MKKTLIPVLMVLIAVSVYASDVTLHVNPSIASEDTYLFPDHDYSKSSVVIDYAGYDASYFKGILDASNLKPNFTYQLKIVGKPSCLYGIDGNDFANAVIGNKGRWGCVKTATNDCGGCVGAGCNRDGGIKLSPGECLQGYLVFDSFTTDENGSILNKSFKSDSSYHVFWCDNVNPAACSCTPNNNAFLSSGLCPSAKVCGEIESGKVCGSTALDDGSYDVLVVLTEESFHQLGGNWATVLMGDVHFTIGDNSPVPEFSAVAAVIALTGAGVGFILLRRKH